MSGGGGATRVGPVVSNGGASATGATFGVPTGAVGASEAGTLLATGVATGFGTASAGALGAGIVVAGAGGVAEPGVPRFGAAGPLEAVSSPPVPSEGTPGAGAPGATGAGITGAGITGAGAGAGSPGLGIPVAGAPGMGEIGPPGVPGFVGGVTTGAGEPGADGAPAGGVPAVEGRPAGAVGVGVSVAGVLASAPGLIAGMSVADPGAPGVAGFGVVEGPGRTAGPAGFVAEGAEAVAELRAVPPGVVFGSFAIGRGLMRGVGRASASESSLTDEGNVFTAGRFAIPPGGGSRSTSSLPVSPST